MTTKRLSLSAPAFTLMELLTVIATLSLLLGLLFPVIGKARAASRTTICLSRLKNMGNAWMAGTIANGGKVVDYAWHTNAGPAEIWNNYWLGLLARNGASGDAIKCPAAPEPMPPASAALTRGFGNASHAWTGEFATNGSVVRIDAELYRISSYGYNRYLSSANDNGMRLSAISDASNVPVFMDCAYADTLPLNGNENVLAPPPPDLTGSSVTEGSPQHWRFLLARHNRGINVSMVDGSARWVPLEELYMLSWKEDWSKYRLRLP